jgi:uncharacterized membrane protein YqhA
MNLSVLGSFFLHLHSFWRWVVLVAGLAAIVKALIGWLGQRPFEHLENQLGMIFITVLDVQVLLGLINWIGQGWAALIPQAMNNSALRFFAIEHPLMMLLALVVAHVGRVLSRRGETSLSQHRAAAIFYTLSLLLIISAIPWSRLGT